MTNQEYMLSLPAEECYVVMNWLMQEYGRRFTATHLAVISWLKAEAMFGQWEKVHGYVTPGGDPVWKCPHCGQDMHVYGVESLRERRVLCKVCGTWNGYWRKPDVTEDQTTDA